MLVLAGSNTRKHAHWLALTSGGDDDGLVVRHVAEFVDRQPGFFGHLQVAEFQGDLCIGDHALAAHEDLAAELHRHIDRLLDAVDV